MIRARLTAVVTVFRKLGSPDRVERLRAIGALLLLLGIAAGGLYYLLKSRQTEPSLGDILPDYTRTMRHEIGVQMGSLGLILLDCQQALAQPGTQAVLVAAGFAIVAAGFFRVAWVLEHDAIERDRSAGKDGR